MNYDSANPYDRRVSKIMIGFIVANIAVKQWYEMAWHRIKLIKRVHVPTERPIEKKRLQNWGICIHSAHSAFRSTLNSIVI